jgi:hypothetical protein
LRIERLPARRFCHEPLTRLAGHCVLDPDRPRNFVASSRTSKAMNLVIAIGDGAFPKDHERAGVPDA